MAPDAAPVLQRPRHGIVDRSAAVVRHASTRRGAWWVWPALVFLITRLIDVVFILMAQREQIAVTPALASSGYHVHSTAPAQPGYWEVATNWDGQWYEQIAHEGYPSTLPLSPDGAVLRNPWAFFPLFPLAGRAVMAVTGFDFAHAAVLLSLTCSLVATVLVYRLVIDTAGRTAARATVLLLCTSMAAATFQIAYTEGLALMLLSGLLLQLRRRRYLATAALILLLGLTRPVVLPLVIVVAAHAVSVYRSHRGFVRWRSLILLALATVAATAAWPLTAAMVTGRPAAFTETQKAWRSRSDVGPFGVFSVAHDLGSWWAVLLCMAAAGILAAAVLRPGTSVWGPELRAWALAYPLYLFAVAPAAVSLFRFWLLAFPLAWMFPTSEEGSTRLRHMVVATCALAGLLAQWYWIRHFLVLGPVDEQFAMP